MVRILAGTLIGVGSGVIAPEQIPAILESKDREAAAMNRFAVRLDSVVIVSR